jgi:hypothetical protein
MSEERIILSENEVKEAVQKLINKNSTDLADFIINNENEAKEVIKKYLDIIFGIDKEFINSIDFVINESFDDWNGKTFYLDQCVVNIQED